MNVSHGLNVVWVVELKSLHPLEVVKTALSLRITNIRVRIQLTMNTMQWHCVDGQCGLRKTVKLCCVSLRRQYVRTYSKCINFHLCSKLQTVVRLKLNYTNVMVIDINQLCCCVVYENLLPKVFVATPVTHNCVVMVVVIMVMVNYVCCSNQGESLHGTQNHNWKGTCTLILTPRVIVCSVWTSTEKCHFCFAWYDWCVWWLTPLRRASLKNNA